MLLRLNWCCLEINVSESSKDVKEIMMSQAVNNITPLNLDLPIQVINEANTVPNTFAQTLV